MMATIGLKNLAVVKMTNEALETYDTTVKLIKGAKEADVSPSTYKSENEYDDGVGEICTGVGAITVTLKLADLTTAEEAFLLGHTVDAKGVLIKKTTDKAPYVALGFKSLKSDETNYRHVWYYKGKFQLPNEKFATKTQGGVTFQDKVIVGTFIRRLRDNQYQAKVDTDDASIGVDVITNWFTKPYGEA